MNNKRREESLTLELLEAIEQNSGVTQRHLARRMGVALGLANSYLKRCVRKGLVKIKQAPANRYMYYLTPHGFAEKSRLTTEYLSYSFAFYRRASTSCARTLEQCRDAGHNSVGLYGASDLAEIAALQAIEVGVQIACLCDPAGSRSRFLDHPVVSTPGESPPLDAWLFTALDDSRAALRELNARCGSIPVYVPSVLGLNASADG